MLNVGQIVKNAFRLGTVIPAFNVPYLPMIMPIVQAVADLDSFALIETARIEWLRFECQSAAAVKQEFTQWYLPEHVRLHLDHIPVVDESGSRVNYSSIIREGIGLGFHSVMVDGSSLDLANNIKATQQVVTLAHEAGIPCEAELGAIVREGGESQLSYEDFFESGKGFTNVEDAARFVTETGCDWLSVAIGNIHGTLSAIVKNNRKTEARLNLGLLDRLQQATGIPLVLHGGSGVKRDDVLSAIKHGIAKVNIGFEVRSTYEIALHESGGDIARAQESVYKRTCWLIKEYFNVAGNRHSVAGD
jgi:fructose-bisphosphate aldolase, class II